MIQSIYGNVLDVTRGVIVHGCNCRGVMGGGIALEVKTRYPEAYIAYKEQEKKIGLGGGLRLGEISYAECAAEPGKFIVNALTQKGTGKGRQVSYDAVVKCFERVNGLVAQLEPTHGKLIVYFPRIGAGLAGGDWEIIEKIIDRTCTADKVLYNFVPPTAQPLAGD